MPNRLQPPQIGEPATPPPSALVPEWELESVSRALNGLQHGEVRLIIQDGIIVQIERVEKRRLC
jgi:hypothetical protein